jgi:hypothetical protein
VPPPLLVAATSAYLANCALGAAVGTGVVDSSGFRWVHHAVYVVTAATTALAGLDLLRRRSPAFVRLLPAGVPLVAIPAVPARSRWHPVIAATAAPAYLLACRAA